MGVPPMSVGRRGRGPGSGCRALGAGCRVPGAGCRVTGAWCLVPGAWCLVPGAWCQVPFSTDQPREHTEVGTYTSDWGFSPVSLYDGTF